MAKLFLIRRNLETFSGPMSLAELKEAGKRLEFGLSDEVSGHCGPWVQLDKPDLVKQHYPEVARIVADSLSGWGVSDHGESVAKGKRARRTRKLNLPKGRDGLLAVVFLVIAALAFAAAVYLALMNRAGIRGKSPEQNIQPDELQDLLDRREIPQFRVYIEENIPEIVARVTRPKNPQNNWLPYLRYYAFTQDGMVPGLSSKWLRGTSAASAPVDCSLKSWRQRWRSGLRTWNSYVTERKLLRAHWARLLAWDPSWIRRRERRGTLDEKNYYVGCLMMADKALAEIYADTSLVQVAADWDRMGIHKINQRLQWLLEITRNGSSNIRIDPAPDQPMAIWSCMEGAATLKDLQRCRSVISGDPTQDAWLSYTDERYGWNLLRLATQQRGVLPAEFTGPIAAYAAKAGKADYFTRFDYRPEQRLLRALGGEKLADKASDKSFDRSGNDRNSERLTDKANDPSVDSRSEKSADRSGERSSERLSDKSIEKTVERTVERVFAEFPELQDGQ